MKKSFGDVMKDTIRDVLASYYALMPVMIDEDLVARLTERVFTVWGISGREQNEVYEEKVQPPPKPIALDDRTGKGAQKGAVAGSMDRPLNGTVSLPGKIITIQVDLIDEIRKEITENTDFNPDAWCEYDAAVLKKAALIIEEGLGVEME